MQAIGGTSDIMLSQPHPRSGIHNQEYALKNGNSSGEREITQSQINFTERVHNAAPQQKEFNALANKAMEHSMSLKQMPQYGGQGHSRVE